MGTIYPTLIVWGYIRKAAEGRNILAMLKDTGRELTVGSIDGADIVLTPETFLKRRNGNSGEIATAYDVLEAVTGWPLTPPPDGKSVVDVFCSRLLYLAEKCQWEEG